ncbi:uncharacterized protein HaLaN_11706 [Haematococcus lacustris]|uniref:RNase III domain-containing protein n=1 Tax=Haematococcus lacustris TaxID=44745 RepID=A0A699Z0F0_HAELA|nr:uncharacterized protein HaLaN_11706 [Haematococcus lacustris]
MAALTLSRQAHAPALPNAPLAAYHDALCSAYEASQKTWVLSEEEVDILRWARNSQALNPPKGCDLRAYKKATALEVLVAHLYLTDPTRCLALVDLLLGLPLTTSAPRS